MLDVKVRFALRSLAATVLATVCVAAPAAAQTNVVIDGSTDTTTCWVGTDHVMADLGGCGQALIGSSGSFEFRGLLQFDVLAHVPAYSSIDSAYLYLPLNEYSHEDVCDSGMHLRLQSSDWLSQTPSWTTPDGGTTLWDGGSLTWSPVVTSGVCDRYSVVFDVTGWVHNWVHYAGGNYGWTIANNDGTPFAVSASFPEIPQLEINYTP